MTVSIAKRIFQFFNNFILIKIAILVIIYNFLLSSIFKQSNAFRELICPKIKESSFTVAKFPMKIIKAAYIVMISNLILSFIPDFAFLDLCAIVNFIMLAKNVLMTNVKNAIKAIFYIRKVNVILKLYFVKLI